MRAAPPSFYERAFGWTSRDEMANGGRFTRLQLAGRDVGSLYQLSRTHLNNGVPSHWTPYIRVENVDDAARRAVSSGGKLVVPPFDVSNFARIALILDSVGAQVGLWQPMETDRSENADG